LDNAVVLVDGEGKPTHRTGFENLGQQDLGGVLVGASGGRVNWIALHPDAGPDHGSGAKGTATPGPDVTVVSVTRGAVELRLVRVRGAASGQDARLRIGGWPVDAESAMASEIRPVAGFGSPLDDAGTWRREAPHPVGEQLAIPWIGTSGTANDGDYAAVVILAGQGSTEADAVRFIPADQERGAGGRFVFADGTAFSLATALEFLSR
jgi:hypothetical protein